MSLLKPGVIKQPAILISDNWQQLQEMADT